MYGARRDFMKTMGAGGCLLGLSGLQEGLCDLYNDPHEIADSHDLQLAELQSSNKPFFFVHLADPQLFWGPLELWKKAIESVNRLKPSFAVVGGDLINNNGKSNNHDFSKDIAMAQAYLEVAKTIDPEIPLYNAAGNHDVCNEPTHETLQWHQQRFGELWYSFRCRHGLFIVLESDILKNPQNAPDMKEKQMARLKEMLQNSDHSDIHQKIVFMHHPMCLNSVNEKDGYFNMPKGIRDELLKLFHSHNVTAVFSGHYHRNAYVKDGDLELVTSASCGKALGKDPVGMRIVKVYPDRIEHKYYSYMNLPARIIV